MHAPNTTQLPIPNYQLPLPPLLLPGHFTLLLGDPGTGKSLLALDLAARITLNSLHPPLPIIPRPPIAPEDLPEGQWFCDHQPGKIIILSREDCHETISGRLIAAGADLSSIYFPEPRLSLVPFQPGSPRFPQKTFSTLTDYLAGLCPRSPETRLLILDPLPAFLESSGHARPSRIRKLLEPLLELADRHRFAILGISHLNKSTHHKQILYRSLGSQAYTALARAVYLVTQAQGSDPCAPPTRRRLLIPLKNNLGPRSHALAFSITQGATIQWEPAPITNHPLLDSYSPTQTNNPPQNPQTLFAKSQLDFALDFLQKSLANGPVPSKTLLKEARSIGISTRTFERARFQLGITCDRDQANNRWIAYPPTTPATLEITPKTHTAIPAPPISPLPKP